MTRHRLERLTEVVISLPYGQILRIASAKVNAVTGHTATALDAAYLTSPLTTTQIGNTDFTFAMIADLLVSVVGKIVRSYAFVPNHPFRAFNLSETANIAHKGLIPSVDSASKPIVGVFGSIHDASTGDELTEQPIQIINTIVDNTDTALKGEYYYYKITSDRLWHTRTNAVIDVVTFSASDELTAINANGDAPLPDACLDIAWTGLCSSLFVDDAFIAQSQACANYFNGALADISAGKSSFAPAPVLISSQAPAIS